MSSKQIIALLLQMLAVSLMLAGAVAVVVAMESAKGTELWQTIASAVFGFAAMWGGHKLYLRWGGEPLIPDDVV